MPIIDLTFNIEEKMLTTKAPWHPKVQIKQLGNLDKEGRNTHEIILGTHTGTHMDAPGHFIKDGMTIDQINPSIFIRKAALLSFDKKKEGDVISLEDIKAYDQLLEKVDAAVIFTGWSKNWMSEKYYQQWPYLTKDAAEYIVDKQIKIMGMDTPSPDSVKMIGLDKDSPAHHIFLNKGIVLVEYLTNLHLINKDIFTLYAFPLKLKGLDGSPARVLAEV